MRDLIRYMVDVGSDLQKDEKDLITASVMILANIVQASLDKKTSITLFPSTKGISYPQTKEPRIFLALSIDRNKIIHHLRDDLGFEVNYSPKSDELKISWDEEISA